MIALPRTGSLVRTLYVLPTIGVHALPMLGLFVDVHARDWVVCIALYLLRMFGITAGYHRYFAHRAFRTGRVMQFVLALLGTLAAQKGVLWWAALHRHHHVHSDDDEDVHSPRRGFWWSHMGWFLGQTWDASPAERIRDFARYPELRVLDRLWWLPPVLLAVVLAVVGGPSMLAIGFGLSTVLGWHATFAINSLAHVWGSRRYATTDTSRNNAFLALLTLGEGWHNNHHHYCTTANQGFFWWELDVSYLVLRVLARVGLVHGLRVPHADALRRNRIDLGAVDAAVAQPAVAPPATARHVVSSALEAALPRHAAIDAE